MKRVLQAGAARQQNPMKEGAGDKSIYAVGSEK